MGSPRTPIGTFGVIATRAQPSGSLVAKARYRDWDGQNRLVQATGTSRSAAERKLKQKLADRSLYQPGFNGMRADSPFPELVAYWLEDMEIEDRLSRTTRNLYERDMRTLVLPAFKDSPSERSALPAATTFSNTSPSAAIAAPSTPASSSDSHSRSDTRSCPATRWTTSPGCTGKRPSRRPSRSAKYRISVPRSRPGSPGGYWRDRGRIGNSGRSSR